MIQKNWQELIKPTKLEVLPSSDPAREATIVAEPLERGFGLTLGNALRRVLLSSLHGAAVTAIKIDGVLHEFSSVPGVREDVTDIVLNIKSLGLRMHSEGPKRMTLSAEGPCEATGSMIETGHDIEVMDPDLVICMQHRSGAVQGGQPAAHRAPAPRRATQDPVASGRRRSSHPRSADPEAVGQGPAGQGRSRLRCRRRARRARR